MNKNTGFTLIEVLIAMLVLAIGLLGLAGLQATSLKNNQSAYNRSQATQLAYDLADRMRANIAGKANYTAILPSSATAKANCLTTTGCTPADMAENDLFEWNSAVSNNLPSGIGTIAVVANMFTIRITWDDDRDGDDSNNPNFQTSFQL
ncbi:MAG TPA: type IV pilus modification protein PilV [Methylobacter sp.]|jgi:type IV pilus assembly protein PilV